MNRLVKVFILIFIVTMLCFAIIAGACLNYNSRIDKLELAIGTRLQPNDSVGFQSYVDKFDIQSNWFIFYVTLLFGIFSIFGYTFIVKLFDGKVRDLNNSVNSGRKATEQKNKEYYEKYAHELKNFMLEIVNFKSESYIDSAELNDVISFLHRSNRNMPAYIQTKLKSLTKACDVYKLKENDSNLFRLQQHLQDLHSGLNSYYASNDPQNIITKPTLNEYQRQILELSNIESVDIRCLGNNINSQMNGIIAKNDKQSRDSTFTPIDTPEQS
ncbi:MAG: hypothetical protein IPG55_10800 [Saprospiraceae bacterium]|nr:hypothetical protein [Candidatus Defluviibacterium haderslevense]